MAYTIEELQEKARELADMVGNEIVDGYLPLELLEMTADALKEDYRQIVQAAEDIREEEKAIEKLRWAAGKERRHGRKPDGKIHRSLQECKAVRVSQYRAIHNCNQCYRRYNLLCVL